MSTDNTGEQRAFYFDFLRVFASIAVIIIHVVAQDWYSTDAASYEWQILNIYDSIVRWAVPVFVMVSGALFLNPDKKFPVRKLYSKYIFRLASALIFWSLLYALIDSYSSGSWETFTYNFFIGHYHLWFLYLIIGLYMLTPFLRNIAESESLTKYFLVLALIFSFIVPQSVNIIRIFISEKYAVLLNKFASMFLMSFVMEYPCYFLLGYVLSRTEIKHEGLIYLAGLAGFVLTIILTQTASLTSGHAIEVFYSEHSINVLFESVAVFIFFKKYLNRENKFIMKLSIYSFGVYLCHDLGIQMLRNFGLDSLTFNPLMSVPVIALIVFVMSYCVSFVINNIPVLKKYIA